MAFAAIRRNGPAVHDRVPGLRNSPNLVISLPEDDGEFLDAYAQAQGIGSRSAVLHKAVALLRAAQLGSAYEDAWASWTAGGDAEAWEAVVGDGLGT